MRSGTLVLASHIPGKPGMPGADHTGHFPSGAVPALLALLRDGRRGLADGSGRLTRLHAQCEA